MDYAPEGEYGREWLQGLVEDLEFDGLVDLEDGDDDLVAALRR